MSGDPLRELLRALSDGVLAGRAVEEPLAPDWQLDLLATLWEVDVGETEPASVFSAEWPAEADDR